MGYRQETVKGLGTQERGRHGSVGRRSRIGSVFHSCFGTHRLLPMAHSLKRSDRGFTILELMIVVSIAGILVMLAEPSFVGAVVKAREAVLKQDLFTMRDVIDQYKADRGKYPPTLIELKEAGYLKRVPMDPFTKSDASWQEILDQADGGVFDVHSGSDLVSPLDGTPYNQW